MPICPGCERTVSYDRLDSHERYCDGIWSATRAGSRSLERMERRITALENRIDRRLRDVEFDVEQKLDRIERAALSAREARGRK